MFDRAAEKGGGTCLGPNIERKLIRLKQHTFKVSAQEKFDIEENGFNCYVKKAC